MQSFSQTFFEGKKKDAGYSFIAEVRRSYLFFFFSSFLFLSCSLFSPYFLFFLVVCERKAHAIRRQIYFSADEGITRIRCPVPSSNRGK